MIEIGISYVEYLNKLKKEELIKIITDYNKMCEIFDKTKIEETKTKKDDLV